MEEVVKVIVSGVMAFVITYPIVPWVMRKMREKGWCGRDVNKMGVEIPEMGGVALLLGFIPALFFASILFGGLLPVLSAMGVFLMASAVGLLDDISLLRRREKAALIGMASLPLILLHSEIPAEIPFPFHITLHFNGILFLIYWAVVVPAGVLSAANAINLSAGYNGLETGEVAIISIVLIVVSLIRGVNAGVLLIFSVLSGGVIALYLFNRYPARTFVGDTATLPMGALIGAAVIMGRIQFFGVVCILPAFYEFFATVYYATKKIERRDACMNPVILEDGRLMPPEGAERYTLAYFILSKRPMKERDLVRVLLMLYTISGLFAIVLAFF